MAFKPNYNQQRAERDRAKRKNQQEKLRIQQERTAQRKAERGESTPNKDSEQEDR
jgi:hypothetical protein